MPEVTLLERSHDRAGFDCGVAELNSFLRKTARQHGQKGISRTFVLTDGGPQILGFFTLTLCEVLPDELPPAYAARFPAHRLPAVRLARLAVSRSEQGKHYGSLLLAEAVYRTLLIAEQAGLIGLFVDAKDENARRFYERFGFMSLPDHHLQLFLPIETIRKSYPA